MTSIKSQPLKDDDSVGVLAKITLNELALMAQEPRVLSMSEDPSEGRIMWS